MLGADRRTGAVQSSNSAQQMWPGKGNANYADKHRVAHAMLSCHTFVSGFWAPKEDQKNAARKTFCMITLRKFSAGQVTVRLRSLIVVSPMKPFGQYHPCVNI